MIYAIGDVQGCYKELQQLLKRIHYNPNEDTLWFTGDLVNRGPQSLETLQFVSQQPNVITVLGNHDLALLAWVLGDQPLTSKNTLQAIVDAPDCDDLLHWLRHQPLLHTDKTVNTVMVHAGLPPEWDLTLAKKCANEVEHILCGVQHVEFLKHIYGDQPDTWDNNLEGWDRLRYITNALTRIRFVGPKNKLDLTHKGPIGSQPTELVPWFEHPNRQKLDQKIIFGHWAAIEGKTPSPDLYALDTGAVWGRHLSALCLETLEITTSH